MSFRTMARSWRVKDIADYRQGSSLIPARMTDEQAYAMANYYELYKRFLE